MRSDLVTLPIILCFFTGGMPIHAAPMLREPAPPIGMAFDLSFADTLERAISINPAVHDGAILIGRETASSSYSVAGWSYRLLPPPVTTAIPNKGSAFNSCLAMSAISEIDALYLFRREGLSVFQAGALIS